MLPVPQQPPRAPTCHYLCKSRLVFSNLTSNTITCRFQNYIQMDSHCLMLLRVLFLLCSMLFVWLIHVAALSHALFTLINMWHLYIVQGCNCLFTHTALDEAEFFLV